MHQLLSFAVVAGIFVITPGLDTFLVLRSALRFGFQSGVSAALGICSGTAVWALVSGAGVAAIIVASQEAFTVLRVVGAVYLFYVGLKALWSGLRGTGHQYREAAITSRGGWQAFRIGLFNNLLNPKVGVFFLTIFPQFIPDHGNAMVWSLSLATVYAVEGIVWLTIVALFAIQFRPVFQKPAVTRMLDVVSGTVFLLFGARVARDLRT